MIPGMLLQKPFCPVGIQRMYISYPDTPFVRSSFIIFILHFQKCQGMLVRVVSMSSCMGAGTSAMSS